MAVLKKATIKSYDPGTHTASVQIAGSLAVWLDAVRVATNVPAAAVVAGRQCSVLFLDPSNQDDALVLSIQGATPPGLPLAHGPVGGLYPGTLSLGVKPPVVPYRGDPWTATLLEGRVRVAPGATDILFRVLKNGALMGTVTIVATALNGTVAINVAVANGDFFNIDITGTGTTPNQGSDLAWLIAP